MVIILKILQDTQRRNYILNLFMLSVRNWKSINQCGFEASHWQDNCNSPQENFCFAFLTYVENIYPVKNHSNIWYMVTCTRKIAGGRSMFKVCCLQCNYPPAWNFFKRNSRYAEWINVLAQENCVAKKDISYWNKWTHLGFKYKWNKKWNFWVPT